MISPAVLQREMGTAGRHKQVYLRPAPQLEKTSHQLPVQAPLRGIPHMTGQVVSQYVVHSRSMNRLQLDVPRDHPLVQVHGFAFNAGEHTSPSLLQSLPQTAKHHTNRLELQHIDVERRLPPGPTTLEKGRSVIPTPGHDIPS